jgi:hypothetical protein
MTPLKIEVTEAMREAELLPCPFCGADGYAEKSSRGYWVAGCDGRECDLSPLCTGRDRNYVATAWNTRSSLGRLLGEEG